MRTPLNSINPEEGSAAKSSPESLDILEQLLRPEIQVSLTALIEQLPKLTEMLTVLNKSYDFAQSVATDEVLKNDTVSFMKEIATPVTESVKSMASTAIEANERANANTEVIGLFGLLKMLKDPQAQKLFRFASAYLQLSAERDNQK